MYDNDEIMAAIWAAPDKCTGLAWEFKGGAWVSQQDLDGTEHRKSGGRTILRRNPSTGVLYINYNGDDFAPSQGIVKYLKYRWSTNDTGEVYRRLGEIYNVKPDTSTWTDNQRQRYEKRRQRQPILDAVAEYVTAALNTDKGKATRDYLAGRNLQPSKRLGAISEDIIKDLKAAISRKYPALSYTQVDKEVEAIFTLGANPQEGRKGYRLNADDYRLIGPYYNGEHVAGFWLRLTGAPTWTDRDGIEHKRAKYLFNDGLAKGGYCGTLRSTWPVILVEGMLDAEKVKQAVEQAPLEDQEALAPLTNVLALGGVAPTDDTDDPARSQVQTLQRYGIKNIIYVPDLEYYTLEDELKGKGAANTPKTQATANTIKALLPYLNEQQDGDGFATLKIASLYHLNPDDTSKTDANDFIAEFGPRQFKYNVLDEAVDFWRWQLETAAKTLDGEDLQAAAQRIYTAIPNPMAKEVLKADVTGATGGYLAKLKAVGFNATAMATIDRSGANTPYREAITALTNELAQAVANKATADEIGEILRRLNTTQAKRTDAANAGGFMAQANATPELIEKQIAAQPEYIQTPWTLYNVEEAKGSREIIGQHEVRKVSFAPAAISVVAAPTNYGKTAFLMQAALYLADQGNARYLYISTEEDQRQMYLRACAGYIGDKWPQDSHPRKDLREAIKYQDMPAELFAEHATPFNLDKEKEAFNRRILRNLKLIYNNEDVTTLCAKITALVEEWRNEGVPVGGIFIDYLQMLRGTGRSFSRTDEMQTICAELNTLAKTTGLAIIVGAQLNRQATQGGTQGVGFDGVELANIGDSSRIEHIANDVYLLWNTDKINEDDLVDGSGDPKPRAKLKRRTRRVIQEPGVVWPHSLYIENMKTRDYEGGAYALVDFNGATGRLGNVTHVK